MELLKQPLEHPLAMHEMVIVLIAAGSGRIDHVEVRKVNEYKEKLVNFFNTEHSDVCDELNKTKDLTDALKKRIMDLIDEFNEEIEVQ